MNIRKQRLAIRMTQESLAEASESHPNYVGEVERGTRNPTATKLVAIADALGVSVGTLFDGISAATRVAAGAGSRRAPIR